MSTIERMGPLLGTALMLAAVATSLSAAEHPTLVKVDSAQCNLCHEDLTEGKPNIHSPVADDCTMCHDFTKDESGTTVELSDSEPSLCLMCHDDLEKAAAMELAAPHMPVEDSCLTCHEVHASEHAKLLAAPVAEVCSNCHDVEDLNEGHGEQLTEATDCTSCHQPHGSDNSRMLMASQQHAPFADGSCTGCHRQPFGDRIRLRSRGSRLCIACHGEFETPDGGSTHGALADIKGRAACLSCHDPHMSAERTLLIAGGPTLCAECHADTVAGAQAETGHAAASDDCTSCHLPHTSEHPRLLTTAPDELCAECHDLEDEDLSSTHLGADLTSLTCTQCHSPHGAGHPKLLAENLHAAIEDGCDICHEGGHNELMEGGGAELCLMCHDDIGEFADAATVPHEAMLLDSCTACHNPHASAQPKLVKLPAGGACTDCHPDQAAGPDEVAHGIIEWVGCEACHEPHGSDNETLLRLSGSELCLGCHGPGATDIEQGQEALELLKGVLLNAELAALIPTLSLSSDGERNHPLQGHRTLGTASPEEMAKFPVVYDREISCFSCHDPHKGRSSLLLLWGASSASEACQACHEK